MLFKFDKVPVLEIVKNVSASGGRRAAGGGHHQISALYLTATSPGAQHQHQLGGITHFTHIKWSVVLSSVSFSVCCETLFCTSSVKH